MTKNLYNVYTISLIYGIEVPMNTLFYGVSANAAWGYMAGLEYNGVDCFAVQFQDNPCLECPQRYSLSELPIRRPSKKVFFTVQHDLGTDGGWTVCLKTPFRAVAKGYMSAQRSFYNRKERFRLLSPTGVVLDQINNYGNIGLC